MANLFWTKCGKIIVENGRIIKCRTCPCGDYYGLFVFVARQAIYDPENVGNEWDIVPCSGTEISIMPAQVVDGKIYYLGDVNIMWSGCIEVDQIADGYHYVGRTKGCSNIYPECVEWDEETGECIDTEIVYQGCYFIWVYRLGPCFDNVNDLKEYVYSRSCPELGPDWPDLWEWWYGNRYLSYQAEQCIYMDYDLSIPSWYQLAYFRFTLKANIHWQRYDCSVRVDTNTQVGHEVEIGRYTWCDGDCLEYDPNTGDCIDCDGTMQEQIMYDWVTDANAHIIQKPSWGGTDVWTSTWPLCELEQGDPECKCIDEYNEGSAQAFQGLNDKVASILQDKDEYWVGQDITTTGLCLNKSYNSRFQPNECWASWLVEGINRKQCSYGKITIEKWDSRVEYSGVKIRIYATQIDGAGSNGNPQNYPLSVNHRTTVLYDGSSIIDCPWGTQIEFPMLNNMVDFSIYDAGHCVNFGDYSQIRYYPYDSGCQDCSRVELRIEVYDIL